MFDVKCTFNSRKTNEKVTFLITYQPTFCNYLLTGVVWDCSTLITLTES